MVEYTFTRLSGTTIEVGGQDSTLSLFAFFGLTYAAFGWSLGRLAEVRRRLQADAATISMYAITDWIIGRPHSSCE